MTSVTATSSIRPIGESELVLQFLEHQLHVRNRQPTTVNTYAHGLQSWLRWPHGGLLVATHHEMEAWVLRPRVRRAHGRQGAAATRKKDVAILRTFYRWCIAQGLLTSDPTLNLHAPTVHNVLPKPVPEPLWHQVWLKADSQVSIPDRVMLGLGYFVGLRRSEITRLEADQITPSRLVGLKRKGGGEDAVPYAEMVGVVADELPHLIGDPDAFLGPLHELRKRRRGQLLMPWGDETGIDPQTVNRRLTAVFRRLHCVTVFTPHQMRHSCATNLIGAGVPLPIVCNLMNHSSIEITMRYVKAGESELQAWRRANVTQRR